MHSATICTTIICGYYPTTLIVDLNKKVSFSYSMLNMELPKEYGHDARDGVDCDSFWEKVEHGVMLVSAIFDYMTNTRVRDS